VLSREIGPPRLPVEDAEWHAPVAPGTDPAKADARAKARRGGSSPKVTTASTPGSCACPRRFEAPVHSHDHEEVFMVLDGSCMFNGEPMTRLTRPR
jgi:hypothetical protein